MVVLPSVRNVTCGLAKAGVLVAGLTAFTLTPTAVQAQCTFAGIGAGDPGASNALRMIGILPTTIGSAITTVNTAFLAQTTAFVASPLGTEPNQLAGGVWFRGVGGRTDIDSTATGTTSVSANPALRGTLACATTTRSDFAGVQGGIDLGRLNFGNSGWNFHFGATAGYLVAENRASTVSSDTDVPFLGLYAALTHASGFYIDAQIRTDFFDIQVSDPTISLQARGLSAQAWGITSSAGYIFSAGNFIIEPSVGVVYSSTNVDDFRFVARTPGPFNPIPSLLQIDDIETLLGRAGLRLGTSLDLGAFSVQPFVAAAVWHEFAGNMNARYSSQCVATCLTVGAPPTPTQLGGTASTTRVGTFGQYSVGFAASLPNTPWLGYLRADFRQGENIDGWSVNGGIRYQFAPTAAPVMIRAKS
jgi:outer membrane autotransporter protein